MELTPEDERRLITELRRRRDVFASEEAAKAAKGKRATAPKPSLDQMPDADRPITDIDLDSLV